MKTLQGPAIFLAQYMGDQPPFDEIDGAAHWAASLGFEGLQIPTWDSRAFNLEMAAESQDYCEDYRASLADHGVVPCELSAHLQGQLVAVHPAYAEQFDGFAPPELRGKPQEQSEWASEQLRLALQASRNLGLTALATFPGALVWPYVYPWPQRPAGLVEDAFAELSRRWRPLLNAAEDCGVDVCFELHPSEDLHDGATWERFLDVVGDHPRANLLYDPSHLVLQGMDYLQFLDLYHERVRMFHVKDAELRCDGRVGVYGGYLPWAERAGRFRSLGDGQIDFRAIFTKLAAYDFPGWAVLEWECAYKDPLVGAAEGAEFIRQHIIEVADTSFDDFADAGAGEELNRKLLGLDG